MKIKQERTLEKRNQLRNMKRSNSDFCMSVLSHTCTLRCPHVRPGFCLHYSSVATLAPAVLQRGLSCRSSGGLSPTAEEAWTGCSQYLWGMLTRILHKNGTRAEFEYQRERVLFFIFCPPSSASDEVLGIHGGGHGAIPQGAEGGGERD